MSIIIELSAVLPYNINVCSSWISGDTCPGNAFRGLTLQGQHCSYGSQRVGVSQSLRNSDSVDLTWRVVGPKGHDSRLTWSIGWRPPQLLAHVGYIPLSPAKSLWTGRRRLGPAEFPNIPRLLAGLNAKFLQHTSIRKQVRNHFGKSVFM